MREYKQSQVLLPLTRAEARKLDEMVAKAEQLQDIIYPEATRKPTRTSVAHGLLIRALKKEV